MPIGRLLRSFPVVKPSECGSPPTACGDLRFATRGNNKLQIAARLRYHYGG